MNVLLSSVSRKVSLARTFKSACKARGSFLVVSDMNEKCPGMYEGDASVTFPALDSEAFKPALRAACSDFNVGLVVPTRDEEVRAFSEWKDEFSRDGVRLLTPPKETVDICQDKIRFASWAVEKGFRVASIYGEDVQFPCFMRSRRGKGSSSAVRVTNHEEYHRYLRQFGPNDTLTQEYVRAPEFSIDVFAKENGEVVSAVLRQRVQIVSGESWWTQTVESKPLQTEAVKLAQALGITGHAVLQCFVRDGQALWIEVNPRFGGASACAFEAGCNSPEWLLDESKCPAPLAPYEVGLTMLRYTQDRFVRKA